MPKMPRFQGVLPGRAEQPDSLLDSLRAGKSGNLQKPVTPPQIFLEFRPIICDSFSKPMVHPHTEVRLIDEKVGHGLFATRLIPRGTITWTRCEFDRTFSQEEVASLAPDYRRIVEIFSYIDTEGKSVLCWDGARNINHSCEANTLSIIHSVDIAIRDIQPNEQITCEYGNCNLIEELECLCLAPGCRGKIGRLDALNHGTTWDELVRLSLPEVTQVAQPLLPFVRERTLLDEILKGQSAIRSHVSYYLPP